MGRNIITKLPFFVVVVIILTFVTIPYLKDSDAYIGEVKGLAASLIKDIPIKQLQSLDLGIVYDGAKNVTSDLPTNIQDLRKAYSQVKKITDDIEQAVGNSKSEELRLISPRQIELEGFIVGSGVTKSNINTQEFEVVDTRSNPEGWSLVLTVLELIGNKTVISTQSAKLILVNLSKENQAKLDVKPGNPLVVTYLQQKENYDKRFTISLELILDLPSQMYYGEYNGIIQSDLKSL
ncbi:hypothetical protein COW99_01310 [Candidatus Roizmanbacteria bacterium CG22_combo_CG10-13_8_21_14_all_38_20]|uniref:Uncharacterized protein n=1 Tax=Candidatus Roizmanbacteria bacterium CG22_combo_CG10-13_8_21_14_all_38_20 TaxID=1974862 RepID=A0A2H0BWM2_9BACT|nr:hypothetical protein [Candidatus Microgenomates bacterium]PIP62021.1 MAG: hypothetical protein COW99_01310 [Candidatus Roizmanbacteria bacterium CG22_combo_CG10-13_8_21_14_all_38_20]PJC31320.1 MAG: hypothetical protein CO050_03585 [Candidatus Roizmanbacteria bacterium CG_4_9_14_0_2_um_filter_38_17]